MSMTLKKVLLTVLHAIINITHTNSPASHKCFSNMTQPHFLIVNDEFDIAKTVLSFRI